MQTMTPSASIAAALGLALSYPDGDHDATLDLLEEQATGEIASEVRRYRDALGDKTLAEKKQAYTRTFDLQPLCIPYLSIHLFGQESFERGRLMTGLVETYNDAGFDRGAELPDHISVVLQSAPSLPRPVWLDLCQFCFPKPVEKMLEGLRRRDNPYQHLIAAVQAMLALNEPLYEGALVGQEASHA